MLNFSRFQVVTFDCYGTLIDWESGIFSALRPILVANGKTLSDAALLELYSELEAQAEQGDFQTYGEVLQTVVRGFGERLGFKPTQAEVRSLPDSVAAWPPFSDTVAALRRLASRYRLAIISNIDDDLFATTLPKLGVPFEQVVTAQQARAYKPSLSVFKLAEKRLGVPREHWLHVGQSIYHDVLPAQSLGLATVWVNRPSPRAGIGAVKAAEGKPDLEVSDLKTLADLALASS
jgi:2-haloacid dehalogenase